MTDDGKCGASWHRRQFASIATFHRGRSTAGDRVVQMAIVTLASFDADTKDLYPLPGTRLKQWVVDLRRERLWEAETCPSISVRYHDNDDGNVCVCSGAARWIDLHRSGCDECGLIAERTATLPVVADWLHERSERQPVTADHAVLSDEYEPEWKEMRAHPTLAMMASMKPRPRDPITQSQIDAAKKMPQPSVPVPAVSTFPADVQSVRDAMKEKP